MKLRAFTFLATALLGVALSAADALAQVTLVSQVRSVEVAACDPPQFRSAPGFGPFSASVLVGGCPGQSLAMATQTSTLSTSQFTCTQYAILWGSGVAANRFEIVFDVTRPTNFSVTGMTNGLARITLTGPGGDVFPPISNATRTATGSLMPGRYTLTSNYNGFAFPSNASINATFSLPPPPPLSIDWNTIDSGGAMNLVGGSYTLSGIVAQPDATGRAALTGGGLSITGGFWAAILPRCDADFNNDDSVNSQDFFDFITMFFATDPAADFNRNGTVNSQDFFDFLIAFFDGC